MMNEDHIERRQRVLAPDDVREIVRAFEAFRSVPHETHREHHEFIKAFIAAEKRKEETIEKLKAHVAGWGLIAGLSGIGYAVWEWVKAHIK